MVTMTRGVTERESVETFDPMNEAQFDQKRERAVDRRWFHAAVAIGQLPDEFVSLDRSAGVGDGGENAPPQRRQAQPAGATFVFKVFEARARIGRCAGRLCVRLGGDDSRGGGGRLCRRQRIACRCWAVMSLVWRPS